LLDFIRKLFGTSNQSQVSEIVTQTKTVIQRYLVGLVIEMVIVAALETATLLILGIDYAILLGIIGALLNLIPYIGGLVAVALPMMVALVTKSSGWYAIYILVIYYVIQLIDNNYIVPKIVASKVKINALFSILAVIVGNALWGVPGMFLSIPLLAIVKLIFDHIEPLKPWGFLLGDTMPPLLIIKPVFKKLVKKSENSS
jgi:predicted PurR-regulated permease PerM